MTGGEVAGLAPTGARLEDPVGVGAEPGSRPLRGSSSCRRVDIEVAVDLESDHNFFSGTTSNIGIGGLFIATSELRNVGELMTVRFTLPGDECPLTADVVVRWRREDRSPRKRGEATGMGVQFLGLPADVLTSITRFVQNREPICPEW